MNDYNPFDTPAWQEACRDYQAEAARRVDPPRGTSTRAPLRQVHPPVDSTPAGCDDVPLMPLDAYGDMGEPARGEAGEAKGEFSGPFTDPSQLPSPRLRLLSYDDMLRMPDPKALVEGVIFEQTSALLYGKSNAYKSFLGIDLACSVATGSDWHGHRTGAPVPVLYIATEGARGVGKQRIPGWMEAHGIPHRLRRNISLYPEEVSLDDPAWLDAILQTLAVSGAQKAFATGGASVPDLAGCLAGSFALIVIDIFGASMNGPETSDETARAWVRAVNRIMREVKCAVLTIAHTGWYDETRARMHTHFWGSFDTRLKAEGDKDSMTTVLSVDRHKDADSTGEWGFCLDVVDTPTGGTTLVPRLSEDVEKPKPQETRRRGQEKPNVAMQALSEALIESGKVISGPNYPTCPVVTMDAWRTMCGRHGLTSSDNPQSLKKAVDRQCETLMAKGLIRKFDGHVWKVKADE